MLLIAAISVVGCAKKQPPAQPVAVREGKPIRECPEAMWTEGQMRPATVSIRNLSPDSVLIYLDRCGGTSYVAEVAPTSTTLHDLPNGAVSHDGLLRFFTWRGKGAGLAAGVEMASPMAQPYVEMTIPEKQRFACPEVWVDGKPYDLPTNSIPRDRIEKVEYLPSQIPSGCPRIVIKLK